MIDKRQVAELMPRLHQIGLAIQVMDNAFKSLSDLIPDEHPLMKDYRSMIAGAIRTRRALERAKKELGVS